jgi:hypothetical protein
MERMITRRLKPRTIWDRLGMAAVYAFLSIPVAGIIFALLALFHLPPDSFYQNTSQ